MHVGRGALRHLAGPREVRVGAALGHRGLELELHVVEDAEVVEREHVGLLGLGEPTLDEFLDLVGVLL